MKSRHQGLWLGVAIAGALALVAFATSWWLRNQRLADRRTVSSVSSASYRGLDLATSLAKSVVIQARFEGDDFRAEAVGVHYRYPKDSSPDRRGLVVRGVDARGKLLFEFGVSDPRVGHIEDFEAGEIVSSFVKRYEGTFLIVTPFLRSLASIELLDAASKSLLLVRVSEQIERFCGDRNDPHCVPGE